MLHIYYNNTHERMTNYRYRCIREQRIWYKSYYCRKGLQVADRLDGPRLSQLHHETHR